MCFTPQRCTLFRHVNFQKWSGHGVFCTFLLRDVLRATAAYIFSISQLPKVLRDRQFLTLLSLTCASRPNGVHFFDISTSRSGPSMACFIHFDLEMCFAPQRRAFFSKSQLPKVLRMWGVLYILTFAPQRRAKFHLSSGQSSAPERTFRPSRATNQWKKTVFRDFPTSSRTCIFFLLTLSLLLFSLLIFSLLSFALPFSDSSHLCFSICSYCRKFDF